MNCPRNQVSASDASNKLLAVLTGLGKHSSPDWGHHFREEAMIPKDWGPSLGNRRASEAMTSDRRSIGSKLQEEESLQQATHSERGKRQGRAKHLAATKYQAGAVDLVIVNGRPGGWFGHEESIIEQDVWRPKHDADATNGQ